MSLSRRGDLDGQLGQAGSSPPEGHPPVAARSRVPSMLDPAPGRVIARAGRVTSFVALPEVRWAAVSLLAFILALIVRALGAPAGVEAALLAACYISGGWQPALAGWAALREKTLDVDLLMIVAALAAAAIGQALDGGLLIVIFATSGALEAVATKRTQDSVRSLLSLAPEQVTLLGEGGGEQLVETATLVPGDLLLVRPGDRVGADGRVEYGVSEVDQASITGEPLPVTRGVGDQVLAGTVNGTGALRVRVERAASDSVAARIVALVAEASATKAKTQLFIESVEQRYSVAMVAATLALFVIPLALGAELQATLLRAMTFMIVASPCAVVLATMPPLLSAIANAGRHGVLVKSAVVMEQLGHTGVVAFDKTGTLTEGTPVVADVHVVAGSGLGREQVLALAAAAERSSEHPLGRAVVAAARAAGLAEAEVVTAFSSAPGRGVTATVDGRAVAVGSPVAIGAADLGSADIGAADLGAADLGAASAVQRVQEAGGTAVVVTVDAGVVAVLGLTDQLRPAAAAAVAALEVLTGRAPVLLTGDNARAARSVGDEVGITEVIAEVLPTDKVQAVIRLQQQGRVVAMVGDGINDAAALAQADLGLAMGTGTDVAIQASDLTLVRGDLRAAADAIRLSRATLRTIKGNLFWAFAYNIAAIPLAALGLLNPLIAGAAMAFSSVFVVSNSLRLRRFTALKSSQ